jgi:predicted DCC family thiol-disulfide oxidoreductase YuxK
MTLSTAVILFDGVCNLCNAAVQFIMRRDAHAFFRFAPLQSEAASRLLAAHDASPATAVAPPTRLASGDTDPWQSIVLIEDGRVYRRSTAVLRIARRLGAFWPILSILLVLPAPWRDAVYAFIARNRYRWFGRHDTCMIPTREQRSRFLD